MTPTTDHLIVRPDDPWEKTRGGLIIPDAHRRTQNAGTVLAVGPGRKLDNGERAPWEVAPGDHVIYSRYNGHEWTEPDGTERVLLKSRDLIAVME